MNFGFLSEENAKREIEKLKRLIKIQKELSNKVPKTEIDKSILPIQRKAVRDKIQETVNYLRRWNVNIKDQLDD